MDQDQVIDHEYQDRTWKLPGHLAHLQVALAQADIDCRRDDADPDELAAARANRLELVLEKHRLARPWWDSFEKYERWHADWALQDYARAQVGPAPLERTQRPLNQPAQPSRDTMAAGPALVNPTR
jgi:hypothetical protein